MTGPRLNPTQIKLSELPKEGRSYTYTRESGELDRALGDLINRHNYQVEIFLKPIGNAFELTGSVKTELDLVCSKCVMDFVHNVEESFRELIVINAEPPRGSHFARTNHASEAVQDGPFCQYLTTDEFDVGEFVHEIVALAEPTRPLGRPNCDDTCDNYQEALAEGWLDALTTTAKESPFSALKDFKVRSKH